MTNAQLRVALFPDAYHEMDGVASTSRHFEAFARQRGLPFLVVHAGPRNETVADASVARVQLRRGWSRFPLDRTHNFDPALVARYRKVASLVDEFKPDVIHITGPSDIGILGALVAHRLRVPLAASWQTNLHQYAERRAAAATSFLPRHWSANVGSSIERWSFRAAARFYKIPRLLFAPNQEIIELLKTVTGKPCFLMSHSVDTAAFDPAFRDRLAGPFQIGYVGRLTTEKNVRALAQFEQDLLELGETDFRIVIVGDGSERDWLQKNMRHADFTGALKGRELARAFANMDALVFPSETETFGLVVLEALASGVPAIVGARGGPKFTVQHGKTGFVSSGPRDFAGYAAMLMNRPDLLAEIRTAARAYALSTSWENIFEGMYEAYDRCLQAANMVSQGVLDVATT
ncbi:MAG: glycosyltransferase [Candidatus Acidiferrales bacterium]